MSDDICSADDVRRQQEQLDFRAADYLRRAGWKSTSTTPGCFVMWEREWQGRVLLVDQEMALAMQHNYFDEDNEDDHV